MTSGSKLLFPIEELYESIKFTFWQDDVKNRHTWSTGWGPCGRWVSALGMTISDGLVTIEQRSYLSDKTGAFGELKVLAARAGCGHVSGFAQSMARKELRRLNEEVQADRKIETFVYQLCDIVSPIKRVHLDRKKVGVVKNPH